jgi:hypothetical protein
MDDQIPQGGYLLHYEFGWGEERLAFVREENQILCLVRTTDKVETRAHNHHDCHGEPSFAQLPRPRQNQGVLLVPAFDPFLADACFIESIVCIRGCLTGSSTKQHTAKLAKIS